MRRTSTWGSAFAILLSVGLLIMGPAAPAAAHPHHDHSYGTLVNDLWKVAFRTQYDEESVGKARDLRIDPGGNLYLCAHFDHAVAPFTGAAKEMTCRAKPGQLLVLIGISVEWSYGEPGYSETNDPNQPPETTLEGLRSAVNRALDKAAEAKFPKVVLDGTSLPLTRVVSRLTHVDRVASPNLVRVYPASDQTDFLAAAWMTVVRATPGMHTVEFRGGDELFGTAHIDARRCWPEHDSSQH